ncbi:MAG: hypothetical protein HYV42_03770 [Candidatus Magasanikbacteria bacterium]|nr:hypothetical protein [Candidatus Magasanikbacteria bacterium]
MNVANLLRSSYWFSQPAVAAGLVLWLPLIIAALLAVGGLVALVWSARQSAGAWRRLGARFGWGALWLGLAGLVWIYWRQQRVFFLAWRFWLWLIFILGLIWVGRLVWYISRRLPVARQEQAARLARDKYLPGSRRP